MDFHGGSDAVEIAMKIARAATGRFKTLSFWDSFCSNTVDFS